MLKSFTGSAICCAVLALLPAAALAQGSAAPARHVCLFARNIEHTEAKEDKVLLFHMRNGDVWRNDLKTPCFGLKTYGYSERLFGDQVCANAQTIHVLRTGSACQLGDFTLEHARQER